MFLGEDVGNNIISSIDGDYVNGTRITALGFQALKNAVDSDKSTAFGYRALRNDNGYGNTAIGCEVAVTRWLSQKSKILNFIRLFHGRDRV